MPSQPPHLVVKEKILSVERFRNTYWVVHSKNTSCVLQSFSTKICRTLAAACLSRDCFFLSFSRDRFSFAGVNYIQCTTSLADLSASSVEAAPRGSSCNDSVAHILVHKMRIIIHAWTFRVLPLLLQVFPSSATIWPCTGVRRPPATVCSPTTLVCCIDFFFMFNPKAQSVTNFTVK